MADETKYSVMLVNRHGYALDGRWVYTGVELPRPDQIIVVELERTVHTPGAPSGSRWALVTRVLPDHTFPIRATEYEL